jgi:peroxiredoxin
MRSQARPQLSIRRASVALLAVACLLGSVAACANDGGQTSDVPTGTSSSDTPAVTSPSPPASGQTTAVPATLTFSAPIVGGGRFDGASLAGKPAVLWFWAAWCPRCRAKAGDVKTVEAEYEGKVTFVGVAGLGSGDAAMAQFVSQYGLGGFTHLADDEGTVWRHFGVAEQEFFVVLDRAGAIVHKGPLSIGDLRQRLAGLVG